MMKKNDLKLGNKVYILDANFKEHGYGATELNILTKKS